jgi:hypothetical protein
MSVDDMARAYEMKKKSEKAPPRRNYENRKA